MHLQMSDLETDRLLLREFQSSDLAGVASWEGLVHAERFLEFCFNSYREWGMGPWAMLLRESGVIVGNCGFCRVRYDRNLATLEYCGEVNYYVAPQHRQHGFASEALKAVLNFGFIQIRLTRIQARCAPDNLASERVLQHAGLKFEGMISSAVENSPQDKLYAIAREDFQVLPPS